jgi:hypothetical protein
LERIMLDGAETSARAEQTPAPSSTDGAGEPICQFYRLIPSAPEPQPADRSADGTLAVDAYRYCEPVASASGFGWHLCPPISFRLMWSGDEVAYTFAGTSRWRSLRGVHYPGFAKTFRGFAPADVADYAPPLLVQTSMPGVVQVWSGYFARTTPGWALLSRGIANRPKKEPYENLEGIVETESWFGPLFTNIRLLRTNSPIHFPQRAPFLQVQPVIRQGYRKPPFAVREVADLTPEDWRAFEPIAKRGSNHMRAPGAYAVATRKKSRNA